MVQRVLDLFVILIFQLFLSLALRSRRLCHHKRIGDASAELSGNRHGVPSPQDVSLYNLSSDVYENSVMHPLNGARRKENIRPAIVVDMSPNRARIYKSWDSMYISRNDLDHSTEEFGGLTDDCLEYL